MHSFNLDACNDHIQTPCHFDSLLRSHKSTSFKLALWLFLIIYVIRLFAITLKLRGETVYTSV